MKPPPLPKENPRTLAKAPGAQDENFYNTATLPHGAVKINGQNLPPAGLAYADTGPREPKRLEPIAFPPSDPDPVPLTPEKALLRIVSEACAWSDGNPKKWAAFLHASDHDLRPTSEISRSLGCSQRSFQMAVAECQAWLDELQTELRAEVENDL